MSWLLTDTEYAEAQRALEQGEITTPLHAFVTRLVQVVAATRSLPPSLSINGGWDADGVDETIAGWWEERLLTGTMRHAFDRCASPRALSRFLETSLRNWLIDRARRNRQPRLLARAGELLVGEPETFEPVASGPTLDVQWGLTGWETTTPFAGTTEELLRHVYALGDFELVRFGDQAEKAEPVISTSDVRRLLHGLLERTGQLITLRQFDDVLRARFPEAFASSEPMDELPESPSADPPVPDQVAALEITRQLLARLTRRQVSMLVGRYLRSATLEQLAMEHGCSRGTADNELRRAHAVLREGLASDDDLPVILKNLLDLASEE
jgi:DNA-directed RNA polymerase specialized sigma24 family protein